MFYLLEIRKLEWPWQRLMSLKNDLEKFFPLQKIEKNIKLHQLFNVAFMLPRRTPVGIFLPM